MGGGGDFIDIIDIYFSEYEMKAFSNLRGRFVSEPV